MNRISIIMLSDTGDNINVTGEPVRADGYFGYKDGLHTVSIQVSNFRGKIFIEGTLASNPTEDDWFPINLGGERPELDFPLVVDQTKRPVALNTGGDTGVYAFNFEGNFLYLRARVDRSIYMIDSDDYEEIRNFGAVSRILLNH